MIKYAWTMAALCCLIASTNADVGAATFYVDSGDDLPNINPGDGEALAANGKTTFRAAVEEANALPGAHTIVFTTAIVGDSRRGIGIIELLDGLVIEEDLVITVAEGVSIVSARIRNQPGSPIRPLEVLPGVKLEMTRVQISEGSSPSFERMVSDKGAVMYIGPGAEVTLLGCSFVHGVATEGGGAIYVEQASLYMAGGSYNALSLLDGGTIYNNKGVVRIGPNVVLSGQAVERGGAILNDGGRVEHSVGFRVSQIFRAQAKYGGGIYTSGGTVSLESFEFLRNEATIGSAIFLSNDAVVRVDRCTFRENIIDSQGAIYIESGRINISQSIFFGNVIGGSGAALYAAGGEATLINCTITENTVGAASGDKGAVSGGAIAADADGGATLRIGNSIVAGNETSPDIVGTVVSLGHNLIGDATAAEGLVASDLVGTAEAPLDPMLSFRWIHDGQPAAPHGIFEPLSDSPAIDGGDNSLLAHRHFVGGACHDFRRSCCPRIRNGTVDIGAIELQEGAAAPPCGGHSADRADAGRIGLEDLLRVIQFFNSPGYHCDASTEDGYAPGVDAEAQDCIPHSSDYNPQDWTIQLTELLRLIQFFNTGAYHPCTRGEDGFCPGAGG